MSNKKYTKGKIRNYFLTLEKNSENLEKLEKSQKNACKLSFWVYN